jgi:hypothetical protein
MLEYMMENQEVMPARLKADDVASAQTPSPHAVRML